MSAEEPEFWDSLSIEEAEFAKAIIHEVKDVPWAAALWREISSGGGLTRENKSRLFELRFGYSLYQAGIEPRYEVPGEGNSTLDFGFTANGQEWLVELMRLEDSDAVQRATQTVSSGDGIVSSARVLSSPRPRNERHSEEERREAEQEAQQSEEGETLKAIERICQKCERDGRPYKFPAPAKAYHVLLVDVRSFLVDGGDEYDRLHIGLGGEAVPEVYRRYWNDRLITGCFHEETPLRGARELRDRVHFIGFVQESNYEPGAFANAIQIVANPRLFRDAEHLQTATASWPLEPKQALNRIR